MTTSALTAAALTERLVAVEAAIVDARQRLNALDAQAGDGDIGESLVAGFRAVSAELGSDKAATVGDALRRAGSVLGGAAPSTFGTLLGMALRDAGKTLADQTTMGAAEVVAMMGALVDGVARRGEVGPGDRSVLDALLASRDRAVEAAAGGQIDVDRVLAAVADGAAEGAEKTAAMVPKVGRARWTGDRSHGIVDAGAAAWATITAALAAPEVGV